MVHPKWYGEEVSKIMGSMHVDMERAETILRGKFKAIVKEKVCSTDDAIMIYGQEILKQGQREQDIQQIMDKKNIDRKMAEKEYKKFHS